MISPFVAVYRARELRRRSSQSKATCCAYASDWRDFRRTASAAAYHRSGDAADAYAYVTDLAQTAKLATISVGWPRSRRCTRNGA